MEYKFFSIALLISASFVLGINARPSHLRHLTALVPDAPLILPYHKGPLLAGNGALDVYLICAQKQPSVSSWWKTTSGYKDLAGQSVVKSVQLAAEAIDAYSLGKSLKKMDLEALVQKDLSSRSFAADAKVLYVVLTSDDVYVEGFCIQTCASHSSIKNGQNQELPYAWAGNSATQCPGKCAWPFASAKNYFGPDTKPLIAPNGDVGMDGLIINLATILAGAATNPLTTGYYQGDSSAPLEAATACTGIFGSGAYSGYPGDLAIDTKTGASFNSFGVGSRMFLLPALWNPSTNSCTYPKP